MRGALLAPLVLLLPNPSPAPKAEGTGTVTITVNDRTVDNVVVPWRDLGAALDGMSGGDVARVYTPPNLKMMRSVGFGPMAYRLRTELAGEAWHWNPRGRWSDPSHSRGYWTSDSTPGTPIRASFGFRLPRRGNTIDQATNNGYSRLDDGDQLTVWKSNPYLDHHYTGEDNSRHPQWVVIDLGKAQTVDTMRIVWAIPYATDYRVEYWAGAKVPGEAGIDETYSTRGWQSFPGGIIHSGRGGLADLKLGPPTAGVRLVRIWMAVSSRRAPKGSRDIRDALGYAIREVYLGTTDAGGVFHDAIRHTHSNKTQSVIYTSSTDAWHRASDEDPRVEQPGFDLVARLGLTNGQAMLMPVGVLYDTPENAAALVRYLRASRFPLAEVEMGEEPDGQYATPEDYGALYVQYARALRAVDPGLRFGGPGFQTDVGGWYAWARADGDNSWVHRFLGYLRSRGAERDLSFFTFEWYPFDDVCASTAQQLAAGPSWLTSAIRRLWQQGVPRTMPMYVTEYGYSSFAAQAEVDVDGALFNAEILGQFLTLGGRRAYFYGLEPNTLMREAVKCDNWGNLTLLLIDPATAALAPVPAYYGMRMVLDDWLRGSRVRHRIEPASSDIADGRGMPLVTAYAQHEPDGRRAVLLINKDPQRAWTVRLQLRDAGTGRLTPWRTPMEVVRYSHEQYVWKADRKHGHAVRNRPPARTLVLRPTADGYLLPPYSLTVLRER